MSPPATAAAARMRQDHSATARGGSAAGALHFLSLFPRVFDLRDPLPLSLSVTAPAAELLAVATSLAAAAAGSDERWGYDNGEGCTLGAI
uniref:Uncharacterized protein n=1 Tax=Oryza barthii TaxID=65489 RepID=A0A0D3HFV8_9ORYZ